ncbi:Transcription factor tfiiic, tau55-related [Globisporangium polare]
MAETAARVVGERKRRRSEGDEQQSARHMSGAASGTGAVAVNGGHERASGRDAREEKHEEDASSSVVNGHGVHAEGDEETKQSEGEMTNGGASGHEGHAGSNAESGDEDEEEDDDVLVVLELVDFKNHPIFDDYRSIRIEGIDTAAPVLQIGEYTLYGQLEETVGTNFFYDTTCRTRENKYEYVGQTTKKIRFTIVPPEP